METNGPHCIALPGPVTSSRSFEKPYKAGWFMKACSLANSKVLNKDSESVGWKPTDPVMLAEGWNSFGGLEA
ncbi:MAG: hypothetical protein ACM3O8_03670 [Methylococcaceae bacterium]|nr:hypothetical protein [Prolixibacteraceae bacterium]